MLQFEECRASDRAPNRQAGAWMATMWVCCAAAAAACPCGSVSASANDPVKMRSRERLGKDFKPWDLVD
jgi:hypothetical protein